MSFFSSLSKKQKESFGLLQIGTILEYFDIMIFVHFAILLNDIFFPKHDRHSALLISAFSFCSTYLLRPIGALIFGYIGDSVGRKTTVILSSFMMGFACILMANMPTYDQIGIAAAYGVTLCRVLQSLSAQGEIIGVEIYLTETTVAPSRYPIVSLTSFFASLGGVIAIGLAVILSALQIDWRLAYWIGAGVSSIGYIARTQLHETVDFCNSKKIKKKNVNQESKKNNIKYTLAYFLVSCGYPACFYLCYIHFSFILKNDFGYSISEIMLHNFILSVVQSASFLIYALLSYRINPISILRFKFLFFFPIILFYPFIIECIHSPNQLLMLQVWLIGFAISDVPAAGLIMNKFPILKRFTISSFAYAFSRIGVYLVTSFGFVYMTDLFGHWGIWAIMVMIAFSFLFGVEYFGRSERIPNSLFYILKTTWKKLSSYFQK